VTVAASTDKPRRSRARSLFETVFVVALAIGLAVGIQAAVAKPYKIPSESMVPTLEVGERVIVDRVSYRFSEPEIGDIVVFQPPVGAEPSHAGRACAVAREPGQACPKAWPERSDGVPFIKRIVAGPGDRLAIRDGHPVVNGVAAEEDFVRGCGGAPDCDLPSEIVIPEGHYFMLGDNRGASLDSRAWGPVPKEWIIGRAFLAYWPLDRIGGL
jgi:signal peptidase I